MLRQLRYLLLGGLLLPPVLGHAAPIVPVPDKIDGVTTVTAEQFINLAERLPELVIIDSRIPEDRKQGYIEHSINLPDKETDCEHLAAIIPGNNTPTLFYCNGVECGRSVVAVRVALACGYRDLYWFRGGFEEWQTKQYLYIQE